MAAATAVGRRSELRSVIFVEVEPDDATVDLLDDGGACRDLAVLLIDACRSVGLATRFVSGFQQGDREQDRRDLHAWAEVYIPGAGWRGFDPTHGLAVADRHVPLAAGAVPESASPVTGSFRGNGVSSVMETELEIQTTECPGIRGAKIEIGGRPTLA